MRLSEISEVKKQLSMTIQPLPSKDISDQIREEFVLQPRDSIKRPVMRAVAATVLQLQQDRIRNKLGFEIPFSYTLLSYGERFAHDASLAALLQLIGSQDIQDILIPGCYLGSADVQFWLRRGVKHLEGIDVYSLQKRWLQILPQLRTYFNASINFQQATIEALPFEDKSFDLISTSAVLEHVCNLSAMVKETERVLRSGGWAWHEFGPMYYCYGGDHCIAAYGDRAGYDHLLLSQEAYQERIANQPLFDTLSDPNLPFWARQQQFSFAVATEYIKLFTEAFHVEHVVVKISEEGLAFRQSYPELWRQLTDGGVAQADLLVKSLSLVLRKK